MKIGWCQTDMSGFKGTIITIT